MGSDGGPGDPHLKETCCQHCLRITGRWATRVVSVVLLIVGLAVLIYGFMLMVKDRNGLSVFVASMGAYAALLGGCGVCISYLKPSLLARCTTVFFGMLVSVAVAVEMCSVLIWVADPTWTESFFEGASCVRSNSTACSAQGQEAEAFLTQHRTGMIHATLLTALVQSLACLLACCHKRWCGGQMFEEAEVDSGQYHSMEAGEGRPALTARDTGADFGEAGYSRGGPSKGSSAAGQPCDRAYKASQALGHAVGHASVGHAWRLLDSGADFGTESHITGTDTGGSQGALPQRDTLCSVPKYDMQPSRVSHDSSSAYSRAHGDQEGAPGGAAERGV